MTKVKNPTTKPATLKVEVDDATSDLTPIAPGETITITTPIPRRATVVKVKYTGEKDLVILETDFR